MPTDAEKFAERYARESERWREYQRNRIENSGPVDADEVIRGINRALDGRERGQTSLRQFA